MLRSVFRNVAISAAAFVAVSVVGLLLVPVLIRTYGLAGFGHIALARLFLPMTTLAFLDFGVGESATQIVARARADGDWQRAAGLLTLTAGTALSTGLVAALVLAGLAVWLPVWLGVPIAGQAGLARVFMVTGALMPLLFLALVLEGIVKGFERFDAMRTFEVVAALSYAAMALLAVWGGHDENAVCYGLLVSLLLRAAMAGAMAFQVLKGKGMLPRAAPAEDRGWFSTQTRAMGANKVLGSAQSQWPPLAVALLLGPTAVGVFDALSRLPRAVKGVMGLLSSTVLPLATRLESAADEKGMQRLGQAGVLLVGLISLPPLAAVMAFSAPVLRLWLGEAMAPLWGWQALLFLVPACSVLVGFGGAALLVRPHVVRTMNKIIAVQIVLQYSLSLLAVHWLQERAFFLGQVLAVAFTFVAQMRLVKVEMKLPAETHFALLRLLGVMVALALPGLFCARWVQGWPSLLLALVTWTLLCWLLCARLVLTASQRARLIATLKARLTRPAP